MTMTVKLMKRVFSRWYGASILATLDMNKQECYAQLNHDYSSSQFVQSQKKPRVTILDSKFFVRGGHMQGGTSAAVGVL